MYYFPGESQMLGQKVVRTSEQMISYYESLAGKFPIYSIEDGLNENKSINQIAKELNRAHSTILREIDRNKISSKTKNWTINSSASGKCTASGEILSINKTGYYSFYFDKDTTPYSKQK